jgi:hypothetical protein
MLHVSSSLIQREARKKNHYSVKDVSVCSLYTEKKKTWVTLRCFFGSEGTNQEQRHRYSFELLR